MSGLPLVEELLPPPDPEQVFVRLAALPRCVFFDSARRDPALGRYSFVAADPFAAWEEPPRPGNSQPTGPDPLTLLAERLEPYRTVAVPGLPPFQGGAAGLAGYDLGRHLERLPAARIDEFQVPALAVGLYDVVVAWDHVERRAWLISQGFPETDAARRQRRARERLEAFRRRLDAPAEVMPNAPRFAASAGDPPLPGPLARGDLAPQFVVPGPPGLTSNFSAAAYLETVGRAIEYIRAGDIFQVNLAQRLLMPAATDSLSLYRRLRRLNPATFAAYLDLGPFQIVSASPERFLQVRDGQVETRPIKGTRRRMQRPEADLFSGDELQQSAKDRAENVMIVDLLRNDLSRVCEPASVQVTRLCQLESYEFVQHLVSVVRGQLRNGLGALDLLRAAFPGGSITGAPKVRAMEIIAELEPTARGAYCGGVFYASFDGALDASILIRTITAGRGWWQAAVGGGIVAPSVPEQEYQETWNKARGLLEAMEGATGLPV